MKSLIICLSGAVAIAPLTRAAIAAAPTPAEKTLATPKVASGVKPSPLNPMAGATPVAPTAPPPVFLDEDESVYNLGFNFVATPAKVTIPLAPRPQKLSVFFDYRDAANHGRLDLMPGGLVLTSVTRGKTQLLTRGGAPKNGDHLVLQRRPWGLRLLVNGKPAATAYDAVRPAPAAIKTGDDSAKPGGKMGCLSIGGLAWSEANVQPVEDISWADDFTRLPDQAGDWIVDKPANWVLTSSSEDFASSLNRHHDEATRITMSTNPFAFRARAGSDTIWAQAGHDFWDNYQAAVSVRPQTPGVIGLAVYVQDAKNYLALQWSSREGKGARQLVRVKNGAATVLAQAPGAYFPRQWYRLALRTSPGLVEATIDGTPVFRVLENSFGQGHIALFAHALNEVGSPQTGLIADFDDARVQSYFTLRSTADSGPLGSVWEVRNGDWQAHGNAIESGVRAGALPLESGAPRLALTGVDDMDGYQLTVNAGVGLRGGAGLVAGYRDNLNYTLFRWAGPSSTVAFKGRQQLVRYRHGLGTIVSDQPLGPQLGRAMHGYAPLVLSLSGDQLTLRSNGDVVGQVADENLSPGRTGLWAQGPAPVTFQDVELSFPREAQAPKVTARFTTDNLMGGWASVAGEWDAVPTETGIQNWNKGDFYGDTTLETVWDRSAAASAAFGATPTPRLDFSLRSQPEKWSSGLIARFELDNAKSNGAAANTQTGMRLSLMRGDKVLKSTTLAWASLPADTPTVVPLRIRLQGDGVVLFVAGRPALSALMTGDLTAKAMNGRGGIKLGVIATGLPLDVNQLRVWGAQRDDYTFTEAPTDWYAPQGDWTVFSSWPCYADWSFFGGLGVTPVMWTKRVYSQDISTEMYVHPQMDLPSFPGYSHPGDLNLTIAGDGKNPSSGYSFVVAGWDNTRTRIMRGDKVVADNSTDAAWFQNAVNTNFDGPKGGFHRHWFYIRAEARKARQDGQDGVRLKLSMDDVPLCEYFDPHPLPAFAAGGRVGIWSVDHGMLVARAKIECAAPGERSLPAGLLDAVRPPTVKTEIIAPPYVAPTPVVGAAIALVPREVVAPPKGSGAFALPGDGVNPEAAQAISALVTEKVAGEKLPSTYTVQNPVSGGLFKVRLRADSLAPDAGISPLIITPTSKLEMDVSLSADVHIDLYVVVDGVPHLIGLSGPPTSGSTLRDLGPATLTTLAGTWKHVNFDLGTALQKLYPTASTWSMQDLCIGALHGDKYRWLGFGGNELGASYQLRGAKLVG